MPNWQSYIGGQHIDHVRQKKFVSKKHKQNHPIHTHIMFKSVYTQTHTQKDQDFPSHRGWLQPKGNLILPMKSNSH